MDEFSQGTFIYGLRSDKHSSIMNYGVIITARCDIAQHKTPNIYLLSALPLEEWIIDVLYPIAKRNYNHNILNQVKKWTEDYGLDFELIKTFGPEKAMINLKDQHLSNSKGKAITQALNNWQDFNNICIDDALQSTRISLLDGILQNEKKAILESLFMGKLNNEYCFIPLSAFTNDGSKTDGFVVDLKDIIRISYADTEAISAGKYDYIDLRDDKSLLTTLNEKYWLTTEDDFVMMYKTLSSPWTEYLMQTFAMSFIRIGVDGAPNREIKEFCKNHRFQKEVKE